MRFFFHLRNGDQLIEDPDGTELPDLEAALTDARVSARHLLADKLRAGAVLNGQRFEITDEAGRVLAMLPLRDVLRHS